VEKAGLEAGVPPSPAGGMVESGRPAAGRPAAGRPDPKHSLKGSRPVYLTERGGFEDTPVYDRSGLRPGMRIRGPAVIEERITTVIVHPGWTATVDEYGNIVMEASE